MDDIQSVLLDQLKDSLIPLAFVLGTVVLLARLVKAQPAWPTFLLILAPVPILVLSLWFPWLSWMVVFYTPLLMLVLLVDGCFLSVPSRLISLSRSMSEKLSIGQAQPVMLTIINNSGRSITGMVRDSIPSEMMTGHSAADLTFSVQVPAYTHQDVSYELCPNRRGYYRFEQIHFRYRSRLGLLWLTMQGGRPGTIKVTPDLRRMKRLRIMASRAQNAGELQKRSLGSEGTQFSGLRHYFAGDDVRKMAWQATAKLDLPVVRTYTHEVEQPILVLLDAGRKMQVPFQSASGKRLQKYDWALNTALAFMAVAIDRGDCVGVGVFSNKILAHIPLGTGRSHLSQILETLGETEVQSVEPDYETVLLHFARRLKRRSLVVLITDLIDPLASRNLLNSLKSFPANHVLMVVTLSDNETLAQAEIMPGTAYEAYRKGVALDLLELRRQTLLTLSKTNNAVVVDAPADVLDETLIQRYLQLKQKNRI
jgi:uncharacterized protein (DUF58 family)